MLVAKHQVSGGHNAAKVVEPELRPGKRGGQIPPGKRGTPWDYLLGQTSFPDVLGCGERPVSERCIGPRLPPEHWEGI